MVIEDKERVMEGVSAEGRSSRVGDRGHVTLESWDIASEVSDITSQAT